MHFHEGTQLLKGFNPSHVAPEGKSSRRLWNF